MSTTEPRREGFWRSASEPDLPMPVAKETPWVGKDRFLHQLDIVEAELKSKNKMECYRGWSNCRLCNCMNGSAEYNNGKWCWPAGYRHYIEQHNVKPSKEFSVFILTYGWS